MQQQAQSLPQYCADLPTVRAAYAKRQEEKKAQLAAQKAEHEAEMARRRAAMTAATEAAYLAMTAAEAQRLQRDIVAAQERDAAADQAAAANRAAAQQELHRWGFALVCMRAMESCARQHVTAA